MLVHHPVKFCCYGAYRRSGHKTKKVTHMTYNYDHFIILLKLRSGHAGLAFEEVLLIKFYRNRDKPYTLVAWPSGADVIVPVR